jgi:hypothetical protein
MNEAIKTLLAQWGASGAILIAVGFYLVKREMAFQVQQARWESTIEARHQEVVTLTKEVTTALVKVQVEVAELEEIIKKCGRA